MRVRYPIALTAGLIILFIGTLLWFFPNRLMDDNYKYIVSAIQICSSWILIGFSVEVSS